MKQLNKRLIAISVLMLMMFMVTSQFVFADGDTLGEFTEISFYGGDVTLIGPILKTISKRVSTTESDTEVKIKTKEPGQGSEVTILKHDNNGNLNFYSDRFINADKKESKKVMQMLVEEVSKSNISKNAQQSMMTDIQESDSKVAAMMLPLIFDSSQADLFAAYKIINPFLAILSVVLGIGAYIIILLLIFSTVMDLLYIGLPVWREKSAENSKNSAHPFGVSYEALTTVKEIEGGMSDNGGGYKNAYVLYFKRRALSYIVLAICILYLVAGQLGGIISFVVNLVSGTI